MHRFESVATCCTQRTAWWSAAMEKYRYRSGDDKSRSASWHEGFCNLYLDGLLQDAIYSPLPDAQVKELLKSQEPVASSP